MPELVRFGSSKVDSKRLMVTFYENWLLKKENKREAFRHAQLSIRQKFPEPRLWGAFVMVGR